jgi:hypothetical protein
MDLRIDMELRDRLLLVTAVGELRFDPALRLLKQICDTANETQVNKIVVNALAIYGTISTVERYSLGAQVATYIQQPLPNLRLAIVGKPPTIDGFGVKVAQNRGMVVEVFSTQQDALNWLDVWRK